MKKFIGLFFLVFSAAAIFAENYKIDTESKIDWNNRAFLSILRMDFTKSDIVMPSGRPVASDKMLLQLPLLIKDPLLWTTVDSSTRLGDLVLSEQISFSTIKRIIDKGKNKPSFFLPDTTEVQFEHSLELDEIAALLVGHTHTYKPSQPIDRVATRKYTGIIIDARGKMPVHGEFTKDGLEPSLFPKIWDEKMDLLFEKNMVEPQIVREKGLVQFGASDDISLYEDRVGRDPLQIIAREVYGIYHTDLVLSRTDALKILSEPENVNLICEGKVVILIDKENLVKNVVVPKKDENYFKTLQELQEQFLDDNVQDFEIADTYRGIMISMHDIRFLPDSAEIVPDEMGRIDEIARAVKLAKEVGNYDVRIEGHTARVGDIETEIPLSERRVETILRELVARGLPAEMFQTRGFGGELPIASNETPEGRALNRRVEIILQPHKK